ncbi:MAG: hypothetical protein L6R38_005838 [Xanthoria sp. 2 TBL-2021]|nr:MAG: hypothetical protein L6R38_005838 [Xanthoria sp. 2 TBL-2021]
MSSMKPPSGVMRDCNAPSIGWKVIDASAVSLSFAIVFVLIRLYVKIFVTGSPGWDDSRQVLGAGDIIYITGVMFAKLSILLLYYRIFGVDKKFRYACNVLIVIVAGYGTSCAFAKIFRCLPVEAVWDPDYKGPERCIDRTKINFVIGWFSIFTDLAILLLPAPMLWRLHLPRWRKFALSVIFMFGAL